MLKFIKKQPPVRILAAGFAIVILLGSLLLCLPFSVKSGVSISYIDALYTSTSAVCVTGLATVDPGSTFTPIGQAIIAILIQIGGLGVAAIGTGIIIAVGKRLNLKSSNVLREAMNLDAGKGIAHFLRTVFLITLVFELVGAALCFIVFVQDYPPLQAVGISLFHSISAFNNAGFDILGTGQSLIPYYGNAMLNIVTCLLIIFGGIGFLVIGELISKRFSWKKLSMHTKIVITVTLTLIISGTLLIKLTENITWLGAFFQSVTSRTAGFCTYNIGTLSNAGLMTILFLMFIGASSGSTGGGIKTTTLFALLQGIKSAATNKTEKAFHYSVPAEAFKKAAVITLIGLGVVVVGTFLMASFDPQVSLKDALFEIVSAFSTTGLSTGITAGLSIGSKLICIIIMYIGRLGPLSIASLWYFTNGERTRYPQGNITIG